MAEPLPTRMIVEVFPNEPDLLPRVTVGGITVPGVRKVDLERLPEPDGHWPRSARALSSPRGYEAVLRIPLAPDPSWNLYREPRDQLRNDLLPARVTAGIRDTADQPLDRDEYAWQLRQQHAGGDGREITLPESAGLAIAELLDELAAVYHGEPLGGLARELAVRLYDKAGV